jgi:hypothetical protein
MDRAHVSCTRVRLVRGSLGGSVTAFRVVGADNLGRWMRLVSASGAAEKLLPSHPHVPILVQVPCAVKRNVSITVIIFIYQRLYLA